MKRKINIALSLIWIVLVYGLFFFMRSQLKFPTLDLYNYGWLVPMFMTVSFWGLVFAFASTEKRKKLRIFTSVFLIMGVSASFFYTFATTYFFNIMEPGIYPLYSETTNPDDYLIFDGDFEGNYERLVELMPEEIPEKAENVTYKYYYNSIRSGRLEASWSLPETDYELLKKETFAKNGEATQGEDGAMTFSASWNITEIPAFYTGFSAGFDDEARTVKYSAYQIYCD